MIDVTITNEQKIQVTLSPITATGKPAKLDGIPTWTKTSPQDPDGATLDVAADGLSAFLISSDTPGDTMILVEADADLGVGVETISDIIQLHVLAVQANHLGLVVGIPVPK